MNVLILGHGRHGKDTFAEALGLPFQSSSLFACERAVFPRLQDRYASPMECFNDRHNYRGLWARLIANYNRDDPARLAREMLCEGSQVYVGMRQVREYEAARHLFGIVFWVEAWRRVRFLDPTMQIPFDPRAMVRIDNNGSPHALGKQAKAWSALIPPRGLTC